MPMDTPLDDLGLPTELKQHSRYQILRLLGGGGMGHVFLAKDRHTGQLVAIKMLRPELWNREEAHKRFRREVSALFWLHHPHITRAIDFEILIQVPILVMEYVEGINLLDVQRAGEEAGHPLSIESVCDWMYQTALGLDHAHQQGIIHRDIKPHNLILTSTDEIKIIDFGLARDNDLSKELTQKNQPLGTPYYMSPEQCDNTNSINHLTDIYSLGCTMYHLLTHRLPYSAESFGQWMIAHMVHAPTPIQKRRKSIPKKLARLVHQMLEKNPKHRPRSAKEVAQRLERILRRLRNPESTQLMLKERKGASRPNKKLDSGRAAEVEPNPNKNPTVSDPWQWSDFFRLVTIQEMIRLLIPGLFFVGILVLTILIKGTVR